MNVPINAKRLRGSLPEVVERVRKGTRFTVIYRSRAAFQIVPVNDSEHAPSRPLGRPALPRPGDRPLEGRTNRRRP